MHTTRLKEFMSHSTESVGSNNASQKHIIGKRKTETDSSASSKIMANKSCPAFRHNDHFRVSMAVMLLRLAHNKKNDIDEIASLQGKAYWDTITKIANDGMHDFTPAKVIALAKEIQAFHQGSPCECLGKALCDDVIDYGAPKLPEAGEIVKWYSGKSCVTGMPPSKKRMRGSFGGASSSLTLESLDCVVSPPFFTAHADSIKLAELIDHYKIHGQLKADLLVAIMSSPATSHSVITSSEWELHCLLKKLSPKAYEEWRESMKH